MIDLSKISKHVEIPLPILAFDTVDSTNDRARAYLTNHKPERMVFLSNSQTAGRGRMGRNFYSPPDTGIYMTYVLPIDMVEKNTLLITTSVCVAVMRALNCGAKIKWINDLYLNGKKICGILIESVQREEHPCLLIGIGINLTTSDFPEELCMTAGAIPKKLDREITIARICDALSHMADHFPSTEHLADYRQNLLGLGRIIRYIENGRVHEAVMQGVDDFGCLLVMENGNRKVLYSGEITLHGQNWEE